jgi:hypothetical protein
MGSRVSLACYRDVEHSEPSLKMGTFQLTPHLGHANIANPVH